MMKNLVKVLVVSLVMVLAIAFFCVKGVNASDGVLTPTLGTENEVANEATPLTPTTNEATNTAPVTPTTPVNTTTNTARPTTVINDIGSEKDLPQTGENDIYIVAVVGALAVIIGSVAYVKSKKYSM